MKARLNKLPGKLYQRANGTLFGRLLIEKGLGLKYSENNRCGAVKAGSAGEGAWSLFNRMVWCSETAVVITEALGSMARLFRLVVK